MNTTFVLMAQYGATAVTASAAAAGFKDGECVAAQRVSPARVRTMADKLALIRKHILQMEHDLRRAATQREIIMEDAA